MHLGQRQIDDFHLTSHHMITMSRRRMAGTSCLLLARADTVAWAGAERSVSSDRRVKAPFSTHIQNFSNSYQRHHTNITVLWSSNGALWAEMLDISFYFK